MWDAAVHHRLSGACWGPQAAALKGRAGPPGRQGRPCQGAGRADRWGRGSCTACVQQSRGLERSCFHFSTDACFLFAVWGRAHHLVSWGSIGLHCRGQRAMLLAKDPALVPLLPEGLLVRLPVHSHTKTGTHPVLLRRLHFRNLGPLDMCLKPSLYGRAGRSLPGFPGRSQALPRAPAPGTPPVPS